MASPAPAPVSAPVPAATPAPDAALVPAPVTPSELLIRPIVAAASFKLFQMLTDAMTACDRAALNVGSDDPRSMREWSERQDYLSDRVLCRRFAEACATDHRDTLVAMANPSLDAIVEQVMSLLENEAPEAAVYAYLTSFRELAPILNHIHQLYRFMHHRHHVPTDGSNYLELIRGYYMLTMVLDHVNKHPHADTFQKRVPSLSNGEADWRARELSRLESELHRTHLRHGCGADRSYGPNWADRGY